MTKEIDLTKIPEFLKRKTNKITKDNDGVSSEIIIFKWKRDGLPKKRYTVYLRPELQGFTKTRNRKKLGKVDALNPIEAKERAIKKWRIKEKDIERLIIHR